MATVAKPALSGVGRKDGVFIHRIQKGYAAWLDCCCSSTRAVAVVGLAGGSTASSGTPAALDQGVGTNPTKPHYKDGGDAAVAQDGLLDMNFCLK